MKLDVPSLWWSTWAVCASAGYTRCSGRTSVYLFDSSLQNLVVLLSVSLWNDLADPVFDGVGPACFNSRANDILLALAALSLFVFYYAYISLLSVYRLVLRDWGVWTDKV